MAKFKKRLIGGLNTDANLNEVAPNDFIDGYDIVDKNPTARNENGLLQPCSNTKLAYDLGEITSIVNKKYKVSMDVTGLTTCDIQFNISLRGFYDCTLDAPFVTGDDAAATLASIEAAFLANVLLIGTVITSTLVSGNILEFEIEISYFQNSQHFLTVTDSLGGTYECVTLIDAVSKDKVGIVSPNCLANINNNQQIFATSNQNKPETYSATISAGISGLRLTFVTDPNINSAEEVYIYPTAGGINQVAGVCTISSSGAGVYQIDASIDPITNLTPPASGTYTVIRYYRTLSVIGYASKDAINDTWTYTELLRSCSLNFRLYKQIQAALDITEDGIIYDWTDKLNPIKRLIYKGEIMDGGFLTVNNADGLYDLDTIEQESRLQLGANTSKVTLSVATSTANGKIGFSAGAKSTACYAAFVRFKTNDGAYTTYSKASNVLWLHDLNLFVNKYGNNSGRAIQIEIEQIEADLYNYVQVGIIEFTTDSWVGYSLPEVEINGQETIYIGDSGFNTGSYLDFNDAATLLEQIPFVFENAGNLLAYNNYRIAANVNLYQEYDLTAWAQTITLTVARRTFETIANDTCDMAKLGILSGINGYDKCTSDWMSYMPYDIYRFCIFIDWENGSPTSTYWIDDVDFDPAVTALGAEVSDTSATPNLYQYYVEATGIDLNYVLPNGKLLKDEVKDIRFGRALCNQQVVTSGCYILSSIPALSYQMTESYYSANVADPNISLRRFTMYSPDFQNTDQKFSFNAGDLFIGLESSLQNRNVVTATNFAMDFYGDGATVSNTLGIVDLENLETGGTSTISNLQKPGPAGGTVMNRGTAVAQVSTDIPYGGTGTNNYGFGIMYYINPYSVDGAYPLDPQQTKFFVLPQDQWFNKQTHTSATVYSIYGGDCFPTKSYYKISEGISGSFYNSVVAFYSFNRTNVGLRSGSFPNIDLATYLSSPFITATYFTAFPLDVYTYDACFTPRYLFQNQVAFNPNLTQYLKKFASMYYSNQSFGSDLSGGNRTWLPLDKKDLESKYGAITDMQVLLGQTGTNILIVWQERKLTAQYFDNTANIKSNTGELLIGNGDILAREGQTFTEYGSEHKWGIAKGQSDTGKDVAYWICFRKTAIMRFGADGTSNIIGDISYLIENKTVLALNNGYNGEDEPAFFNGVHAVWDNKRAEYILTLRLMPKIVPFADRAELNQFKADPTLRWGFEQFPVIYRSLINNNNDVPPSANWETISGYDSEYFEILTIVWSEKDNKFKTFRTHNPKIYGQFNDTIVSSHPVQGNLIYEHNSQLSEALYYAVETTTAVTATTEPLTFRINGTNIQATFPSPFAPNDREKYIVTINGSNYEVVGTGTNYLEMANVDSDDILPQVTIPNFSYSVVNSQDPYITGVLSNPDSRYFHYVQKTVQSDDALKRTEYEAGFNGLGTALTTGFTVKSEEVYQNGTWSTQIKQDTTSNPTDNKVGANKVEGIWAKFKNIFRWGKNNKVYDITIEVAETQKTK